jgi:osmotically-inducible protein OsmY
MTASIGLRCVECAGRCTWDAREAFDGLDELEEPDKREHESAETSMANTTQQGFQSGLRYGMRDTMSTFAIVRKFRFGADVQASDGAAGSVVALVVDGQRRTLIEVGIGRGPFRPCAFVSLAHIIEATAETLTLDLSHEQIERQTTPAGMILTAFTTVRANGVYLGRLAQMTVTAPSGTMRHFVVAQGHYGPRREAAAPARIIIGMTARQISVRLDGLPQKRLLPYRADTVLRHDVYARLFDYAPLRVDLPGIEIQPMDGMVWLRGHVASGGARRMAEDQAQGVRGLTALRNELMSDDALAAAVSMALARDPGAGRRQHIGVYPRLGVVYLRGSVPTLAARERASIIASTCSMVKGVINELRVTPSEEGISALAGVTNHADVAPGGS